MIKVITNNLTKFHKIGWTEYATVEESLEYLKDWDTVGYDSETTGLGFTYCSLWCIQIGTPEIQYVIDTRSVDVYLYKNLLEEKTLIGQNLLFDLPFLYGLGIRPMKIIDTLLNEQVLTMGIQFKIIKGEYTKYERDLGANIERYLNIKIDKEEQGKIAQTGLNSISTIEYSGTDVKYLHQVNEAQQKLLDRWDLKETAQLEYDFTCVLAYIEYCGIYLDLKDWKKKCETDTKNRVKWQEALYTHLESKYPDLADIFGKDVWNSPTQTLDLLDKIGVKPVDKKDKPSVGDEAISSYIIDVTLEASTEYSAEDDKESETYVLSSEGTFEQELLTAFRRYTKARKRENSFGLDFFDYVQADGRIHTKYKQLKDTGRTGCGSVRKGPFPNMQQLPADADTRNCFKGKGPNHLIICDYSSQEQVITADLSEEPALLEFYRAGQTDMHSYVTKMRYPEKMKDMELSEIKKSFPKQRSESKGIGFAVNYGGNGYTIANNLGVDQAEGDRLYNSYMEAFPRLAGFFEVQRSTWKENGYMLIPDRFKRKRFVEGFSHMQADIQKGGKYNKKINAIERESLNTPSQGMGANMSKLAGVYILKEIVKRKWWDKVKMVGFFHDEYALESHQKTAPKVAEMVQECMERAGNELLKHLTITAEPEVSKVWTK